MSYSNHLTWPEPDKFLRHGIHSWVDYSKPWATRRRFLVTEANAQILSSLIAVALTLVGPRLWILIKALMKHIYEKFRHSMQKRLQTHHATTLGMSQRYGDIPLQDLIQHNARLANSSRSELGAALSLLRSAWIEIKTGAIRLSFAGNGVHSRSLTDLPSSTSPKVRVVPARKLVDSSLSIIFSLLLLALFVAQTTGALLSSRIISDRRGTAFNPPCHQYSMTELPNQYSNPHCFEGADHTSPQVWCPESNPPYWTNGMDKGIRSTNSCLFNNVPCKNRQIIASQDDSHVKNRMINSKVNHPLQTAVSCTTIPLVLGEGVRHDPSKPILLQALPLPLRNLGDPINILESKPYIDRDTLFLSSDGDRTGYVTNAVGLEYVLWRGNDTSLNSEIKQSQLEWPQHEYLLVAESWRDNRFEFNRINNQSLGPQLSPCVICALQARLCDTSNATCWPMRFPRTKTEQKEIHAGLFSSTKSYIDDLEIIGTFTAAALSKAYLWEPAGSQYQIKFQLPQLTDDLNMSFLGGEEYLKHRAREWAASMNDSPAYAFTSLLDELPLEGVDYMSIPPAYRRFCSLLVFDVRGWENIEAAPFIGLLTLAAAIATASIEMGDNRLLIGFAYERTYEAVVWFTPKCGWALRVIRETIKALLTAI